MLIDIAIALLWVAIGVLVLGIAVYLILRVLRVWGFTIDGRIEQTVWLIFAILILIAILMTFRGGIPRGGMFWGRADISTGAAAYARYHGPREALKIALDRSHITT